MTAGVAQSQGAAVGNARSVGEHLKSSRPLTGGVGAAHAASRAGGGVPAISSDRKMPNMKVSG